MIATGSWPTRVRDFIHLGRPLFLAGGFLMCSLGAVIAFAGGASLSLPALVWGQIAITAIQSMTHYCNDYFDLAADRANQTPTRWSGGSRVLAEGRLPPPVALATALVLACIALAAALILAGWVGTGPLTVPLIAVLLILAWFYSAPPLRLHSRGLGELTTALLVTGMTPLVGFYLQMGQLDRVPLLAVIPLCCLQFTMLMLVEFPDAVGDATVGKRTLIVRLGARRAAWLYEVVLAAAYVLLPLLVWAGLPPIVAAAVLMGAPLALWLTQHMARRAWADPARWSRLCFWGIGLLMATGAAELLAFLALGLAG